MPAPIVAPVLGCVQVLAAEAPTARAPLYAAVITASVAVLVAVIGQFETWRRERAARRYERRRRALLDVQDAALALRSALRAYGPAVHTALAATRLENGRVAPDPDARRVSEAEGLLEVTQVRLDDDTYGQAVAESLHAWRQTAAEHFLTPREVPATEEQAAWTELHEAVAQALRR